MTALIWRVDGDSAPLLLDQHEDRVLSVEFDPTGRFLGTASRDGKAIIWTSKGNLYKELDGHDRPVNRVRFAPHDPLALTASDDNTAKLRDVSTGNEIAALQGHDSRVIDAAFSADGSRVLTASVDGAIGLWRLVENDDGSVRVEWIAILRGHERHITSAKFSADGEWVISASKDHTARLWRATDGQSFAESLRQEQDIRSFAFSEDGKWILTAAKGGLIRIWDAVSHEPVNEENLASIEIISTGFSSDGKLIALAHEDGAVSLYDKASLEKVGRNLIGHEMRVRSVDFSSDDKWLVTSSADKTAWVWDLKTRRTILRLNGHDDNIRSAEFSRDGRYVLTSSWDRTVRLWDVETGEEVARVPSEDIILDAAFDPSGKRIAHLVRNQVRFRPIYATLEELIHAAKAIMPRSKTRTERIGNAAERPVGWFDDWLDLIKDPSSQ